MRQQGLPGTWPPARRAWQLRPLFSRAVLVALLTVSWLEGGCSKEPVPDGAANVPGRATSRAVDAAGPTPNVTGPETAASPTGVPSVPVASEPVAAVQNTLRRLAHADAVALWEFLPTPYQSDINRLVREFAEPIDEELWRRSVELLRTLHAVLTEHGDWLVHQAEAQQALARANLSEKQFLSDWRLLLDLSGELLGSSLADLHQLRNFDGRRFFQNEVTPILQRLVAEQTEPNGADVFWAELTRVRIELVRRDGDRAVLRLTLPDGPPREHAFQKVEDKWIPAAWVAEWPRFLTRTRDRLRTVQMWLGRDKKQETSALLEQWEKSVRELRAAATEQQFAQAWKRLLAALPADRTATAVPRDQSGRALHNGREPSRPLRTAVTLIVRAKPTAELMKQINQWLQQVVPENETLIDLGANRIVVIIEDAPDLQRLVPSIRFGTVTDSDVQTRTMTVKPLPARSAP
ncbi:MAG: hypothetical protein GXP27_12480 [Planctomycetes bacterium]|nr:hypothetical protein [Planctomycetota bacterium]